MGSAMRSAGKAPGPADHDGATEQDRSDEGARGVAGGAAEECPEEDGACPVHTAGSFAGGPSAGAYLAHGSFPRVCQVS